MPVPLNSTKRSRRRKSQGRFTERLHVETLEERLVPAGGLFSIGSDPRVIDIEWTRRDAAFNNEIGLFIVDDTSGRIGNLNPGDSGYAAAALQRSDVIFRSGQGTGARATRNFSADTLFGVYLVQNSTTAAAKGNPTNTPGAGPITFFSIDTANPDKISHAREQTLNAATTRFSFEDLLGGGDRDYNDAIITIRRKGPTTAPATIKPVLSLPGNPTQTVDVHFRWTSRSAAANNEMGLYLADDAQGTVNGIRPGQPGYRQAVLNSPTRRTIFASGESAGAEKSFTLPGGSFVGTYLVFNGTTQAAIERGLPVYFSAPAANADGFDHLRDLENGGFAWEDLPGGGDRDFNDMVGEISIGLPRGGNTEPRDTTPPAVSVRLANDTGASSSDRITKDPTLLATITDTSAITLVEAAIDSSNDAAFRDVRAAFQNGTLTLDRARLESILGSVLNDREYSIFVRARDEAGNRSQPTPFTFTLDTTIATPTLDLAEPFDSAPVGDRQTTSTVVTLTGLSDTDTTITVSPGSAQPVVGTDRRYSITSVPLALGGNPFQIQAVDIAGNEAQTTVTITRIEPPFEDETPPTVQMALLNDTGSSNTDKITFDPAFRATITDENAITKVEFALGGRTNPIFVDVTSHLTQGNVDLTRSAIESLTGGILADDELRFLIRATDSFGNRSSPQELLFTLDTLLVTPTLNLAPSSDTGSVGDRVTTDEVVNLVGTTDPGVHLMLEELGLSSTSAGDGSFSFGSIDLAIGANPLTVVATDVAGNRRFFHTTFTREICDFEDNLAGWTTTQSGGSSLPGTVAAEDCAAILHEGDSFVVELTKDVAISAQTKRLVFTYADLNFDTTDPSFINDAFEVALVDQHGFSLLPTYTTGRDAFFNITEDLPAAVGDTAIITVDGNTVTVNLASVPIGSQATLVFRLVNNDDDTQSSVRLTKARFEDDPPVAPVGTKFYVADATAGVFRHAEDGAFLGSFASGDTTKELRGASSIADGSSLWTIATDGSVLVQRPDGTLRGTWLAHGLADPEGVEVVGADVWVVDASLKRAILYTFAAGNIGGVAAPSSSFTLASANLNPTGIASDGTKLFVTDDLADSVFVYSLSGTLLGQWSLDPANADPSDLTTNPAGGTELWVLDRGDLKVYAYATGTTLTTGTATATSSFNLNTANTSPEGLADPPPQSSDGDSELTDNQVVFTTTDDFEVGTLFNVNTTDLAGSVVLNAAGQTEIFPFIWASNSGEGTVSKYDTRSGIEVGRYRTGPASAGGLLSPSRTAVDSEGNVWVANRSHINGSYAQASIVKILNQGFNDRNANGVPDTATDGNADNRITGNEILGWAGTAGDLPADEKVTLTIPIGRNANGSLRGGAGVARSIAIDADDNVWVGLFTFNQYEVYDGRSGNLLAIVPVPGSTPYGAVIDADGILWGANRGSSFDRIDTKTRTRLSSVNHGGENYGISIGPDGVVWTATYSSNPIRGQLIGYDPTAQRLIGPFNLSGGGRGVAVGQDGTVFVATNSPDRIVRYKFNPDRTLDGTPAFVNVLATASAAVVDADGFVWTTSYGAANQPGSISKIDPETMTIVDGWPKQTGLQPYNYSDMTGAVRLLVTNRTGTWTEIMDSGRQSTQWGSASLSASSVSSDQAIRINLDFDDLPQGPVASDEFLDLGVVFENVSIVPQGTNGVDGSRSSPNTVGIGGPSTSRFDGKSALDIAATYSISPRHYPGGASFADVLFFEPGTDRPAVTDYVSIFAGFDFLSADPELNGMVIEAFDADFNLIDYKVASELRSSDPTQLQISAAGIRGVRITQSDGLTFDDFEFSTPMPIPGTLPDGVEVQLRVRASDNRSQLPSLDWTPVLPGDILTGVKGRYLEAQIVLESTEPTASPSVEELTILAVPAPTIEVSSPIDGTPLEPGTVLLSGLALPGLLRREDGSNLPNRIVLVTVNGQPVDALDPAGNFFAQIDIKLGQNGFTIEAMDAFGQTAQTTVVYDATGSANFDLSRYADITGTFEGVYYRTSFDDRLKRLYVDLATKNKGAFDADVPLLVGVRNISDPTVKLLGFDGLMPDGTPYFDFSRYVAGQRLGADEETFAPSIVFENPTRSQFDYDLVFYAKLNEAPEITTVPDIEALAGRTYRYDVDARDADGDTLTYSFENNLRPVGMAIDAATGLVTWSPTTDQIGNHDVVVLVNDGRGGIARQRYVLSVIAAPPNRPPVFTSTPVTEAERLWSIASTNLIQNGSFEDYLIPEPSWTNPGVGDNGILAGSSSLVGWEISAGSIDYVIGWQSSDRRASLDLAGSRSVGQIRQNVSTIKGTAYELSFDLSANPNWQAVNESPLKTVVVGVNGTEYQLTFDSSLSSNTTSDMKWAKKSIRFVATLETTTISLGSNIADAWTGPVIDNVVLQRIDGLPYFYDSDAIDADGDTLTYSLVNGPDGMTVNPLTGEVLWAPTTQNVEIVNQAGDRDSFGTNLPISDPINVHQVTGSPTDGGFDTLSLSSYRWTHSFALPPGAEIVGASLKIATLDLEDNGAGDGLGSEPYDSRLFLDGVELAGAFDDTYTPDSGAAVVANTTIFTLDSWMLMLLQDGVLNVILNPNGGSRPDSIAVDYAELTLSLKAPPPSQAEVVIQADDGQGGIATQEYIVCVKPDPNNNAPIIVSDPVTTLLAAPAAGRIIVANDEWAMADYSASSGLNPQAAPNDPTVFAQNVAMWFLQGSSQTNGRFHAFSNNLAFTGAALASAMASQGHAWSVGTAGFDFSLSNILTYDAIFLAQDAADNEILKQYVRAGGNVYLAAGAGVTIDAASEANRWNSFLREFGLELLPSYDPVSSNGNIPITSSHPLFAGVDSLINGVGQPIILATPPNPRASLIVNASPPVVGGPARGMYAVFDGLSTNYTYDVDALDPDGDTVTYSLVSGPEGMAIAADTGLISWTRDSNLGAIPQLFERNGHYYGIVPSVGSWTDAEAFAVSLGGHLVAIDNADENLFIEQMFLTGPGQSQDYWIGLSSSPGIDIADPFSWAWIGDSTSSYRNWRAGQPDITTGQDYYAAINFLKNGDSRWDNYPNTGFREIPGIFELQHNPFAHIVTVRASDNRSGFDEQTFTIEVTAPGTGEIRGMKFEDLNGDGDRDNGERSLSGWTIYIDSNRNGERDSNELATITDSQGNYAFKNLLPGIYVVREESRPGWAQTTRGNSASIILNGDFEDTTFELLPNGTKKYRGWTSTNAGDGSYGIFQESINYVISIQDISVNRFDGNSSGAVDPLFPYVSEAQPNLDHFGYVRPSAPAPLTSFREMASDPFFIDGSISMDVWREDLGSLSRVRFHDAATDELLNEFEVDSVARRWQRVTFDTADMLGRRVYVVLYGGTRTQGSGWLTLFDNITGGTSELTDTFGIEVSIASGEIKDGINFGNRHINIGPNQSPVIADILTQTATVYSPEPFRVDPIATDPESDLLSFDLLLRPDGMTINPNTGTVVWIPREEQLGTHPILLRVQDGRGGLATKSFNIEVVAPNNAPVFTTTPNTKAIVGNEYRYAFAAQDPDGDIITYSLAAGAPAGMSIDPQNVLDGSGTVIARTHRLVWPAPIVGTPSVTLIAKDSHGLETQQTFTVNVLASAPNTAPRITSLPSDIARAGLIYVYAVRAEDTDGDPLSFSYASTASNVALTPEGILTWKPTGMETAPVNIQVTVRDGRGGEATQDIPIRVVSQATNTPPRITSNPVLAIRDDDAYAYRLTASDTERDPVLFSLDKGPLGMWVDVESQTLRWQPRDDQEGAFEVVVRASDPFLGTTTQSFFVTVTCANQVPMIRSTPPTEAFESDPYLYAVRATDPENDTLKFFLDAKPAGMSINENTGLVQWTPGSSDVGQERAVVIRVDDGHGGKAIQQYKILVQAATNRNRAPVITSSPVFAIATGDEYRYPVIANDPDGDRLTYGFDVDSGGNPIRPAGMAIDANGIITWNTTGVADGIYTVSVKVSDPSGASSRQGFAISVRANQPPVITSTATTEIDAGDTYRYTVFATDDEGVRNLSYSVQGPEGMTIDAYGRIVWKAPIATPSTPPHVVVTVTDSRGLTDTEEFDLVVRPDNTPPTVGVQVIVGAKVIPNGGEAVINSIATIFVSAYDKSEIATRSLTVDGQLVPLDELGRAQIKLETLTSLTVVASATDAAGNPGQATTTINVIERAKSNPGSELDPVDPGPRPQPIPTDNRVPNVKITKPGFDAKVETRVDIEAKIDDPDDNLWYWKVLTARVDQVDLTNINLSDPDYRVLASGNEEVDGYVATFEATTRSNDPYVIFVVGYDSNGEGYVDGVTVNVEGNAKFGEFRIELTDLSIPLAGIPIDITRVYDTRDAGRVGDFGYGWSLGVQDARILETVPTGGEFIPEKTKVYLTTPDGRRVGFTYWEKQLPVLDLGPLGGTYYGGLLGDQKFAPMFRPDPGVYETLEVDTEAIFRGGLSDVFGEITQALGGGPLANFDVYTLTTKDGFKYRYNQFTGLERITDPNGNYVTFTDTRIEHVSGQGIDLVRDARGRIKEIIDPAGNKILYGYDAKGDLVSVTSQASLTTTYNYDDNPAHFLDEAIDANGQRDLKVIYDSSGRFEKVIDADGNTVSQQNYGQIPQNVGIVRDANLNETRLEFDPRGNVTKETDPEGNITIREYGDSRNPDLETKIVDRRGFITTRSYDERGNVLEIRETGTALQPFATPIVTKFTYNSRNDVTSITNALGQTTKFEYDGKGNLLKITNADNKSSTFKYDDAGRKIEHVDFNGNKTQFVYTAPDCGCSNPREIIYADGTKQKFDYNQFSQVTKEEYLEADGTVVQRREWKYDNQGRLLEEKDGTGNIIRKVYSGDLLDYEIIVSPDSPNDTPATAIAQRKSRITDYDYDANGRVIRQTDANGGVINFRYDPQGNRVLLQDPVGNITTWVYDSLNRVVEERDPLYWHKLINDTPGSPVAGLTGNALLLAVVNYNQSTPSGADPDSNIGAEHVLVYDYDAEGNRSKTIDRNGRVRTFVYDHAGRLLDELWWQGTTQVGQLKYRYDVLGNMLLAESYDAASVLESKYFYTYDTLNRQKTVDNAGTPDAPNVVLTYGYDNQGNVTSTSDNWGVTVGSTYDQKNRLNTRSWFDAQIPSGEEADVDPVRVEFKYNAAGRETRLERWADIDDDGQVDDFVGYTFTSYDLAGRTDVLSHRNAVDQVLSGYDYDYDFSGLVIKETRDHEDAAFDEVIDYKYDLTGQLTDVDYRNDTQPDEFYRYDANGNRTSSYLHASGYRTDPGNRLRSDGTFNYSYDDEGNQIKKVNIATGETTTFSYDHRNRLVRVDDWSSDPGNPNNPIPGAILTQSVTYAHDALGRRIASAVDADGAGPQVAEKTIFVFNGDNTWADFNPAGGALTRYLFANLVDNNIGSFRASDRTSWYLPDKLGTIRDLFEEHGTISNHNSFSSFGTLLAPRNSNSFDRFRFTGREQLHANDLTFFRSRIYDSSTGRFLQSDRLGFNANDPNLYRYVLNRPNGGKDPTGDIAVLEYVDATITMLDSPALAQAGFYHGLSYAAFNYLGYFLETGSRTSALDYLLRDLGAILTFNWVVSVADVAAGIANISANPLGLVGTYVGGYDLPGKGQAATVEIFKSMLQSEGLFIIDSLLKYGDDYDNATQSLRPPTYDVNVDDSFGGFINGVRTFLRLL